MTKVPKFSKTGKPSSFPIFQGQTVTCPGLGEGFIFLICIKMQHGRERGRDVIVRYREDPAAHVRTYPIEEFFIHNKQLPTT